MPFSAHPGTLPETVEDVSLDDLSFLVRASDFSGLEVGVLEEGGVPGVSERFRVSAWKKTPGGFLEIEAEVSRSAENASPGVDGASASLSVDLAAPGRAFERDALRLSFDLDDGDDAEALRSLSDKDLGAVVCALLAARVEAVEAGWVLGSEDPRAFGALLEGEAAGRISSGAVESARSEMQEAFYADDRWAEYILEDAAAEVLPPLGFKVESIDDIHYDVGFGQGDGASFRPSSVDLAVMLASEGRTPDEMPHLFGAVADGRVEIKILDPFHRAEPHHAHSTEFSVSIAGSPDAPDAGLSSHERLEWEMLCLEVESLKTDGDGTEQGLQHYIEDRHAAAGRAIYGSLADEILYRTEDEALAEDSEANGILFNAAGERVFEEPVVLRPLPGVEGILSAKAEPRSARV